MPPKHYCLSFILLLFTLSIYAQVTSFNFDPNKVNLVWSTKMDSLFQEDQQARLLMMHLKKEGARKQQIDSVQAVIRKKDEANLRFVTSLIDEQGWLGPQEVGFQGAQSLFLVIQHADLNTQKKYYPLIVEAEKEGKILSSNVAILEDRIAVREGRPQTYGSQGFYDEKQKKTLIYPLVDAEKIDELRKARGLSTMRAYFPNWNLQDYSQQLPYLQERLKADKISK